MSKKKNQVNNNKNKTNTQEKLFNIEKSNVSNDADVNHQHNTKKVALGINTKQR